MRPARARDFTHPLLETREVVQDARVILVGTDKGLCGALNTQPLPAGGAVRSRTSTVFITAGRKAAQFVARTRRQLAAEFTYKDAPRFAEARAIATFARDLFLKGEVDQVQIVLYTISSTR